jgi:hypothetical protein
MADRVKVIVHDTRLAGDAPWHLVNATCVVNKSHSLQSILNWINVKATKYGYIDDLYIMAHGAENATGKGGFGVILGSEWLILDNVHRWIGVKGNVGHIWLLACKAAEESEETSYYSSGVVLKAHGFTLCKKLARYTGALVTASDTTQYYYRGMWGIFGDTIDYGDWEGTVYTWDGNGNCIDASVG